MGQFRVGAASSTDRTLIASGRYPEELASPCITFAVTRVRLISKRPGSREWRNASHICLGQSALLIADYLLLSAIVCKP